MGADIHMYVEKVSLTKRRDVLLSSLLDVKEYDIKNNWELVESEIFSGRNYYLFGKLADVRTRNGVIPLSDPKGVPDDASEGYLSEVKSWNWDGHSHSYFYLSELINDNWKDIDLEMAEIVERLKSEYIDYNSVRIVFFFDN